MDLRPNHVETCEETQHHEQQLLFGLGYELHKVLFPQIIAASSPTADATDAQFFYALPTILPNVAMGWRRQHLTLNIDGQMYMSTRNDNTLTQSAVASSGRFASSLFFGSNFAARVSISYRLGRNPDAARPADARQ